jgi:alpha-L-rhamnosidase
MKSLSVPLFVASIFTALFFAAGEAGAGLTPVELRCDYTRAPLGIDSPAPRLFWQLESGGRNEKQTAYEILAASSEKNLARGDGNLWASGKVVSDETIQIPYAGQRLISLEQVFWKVRVWDREGKASAWSKSATWTM